MTIGSELTFFQRRLTNGQYVQYQIFNITNLQGNANQNHNDIPLRMAVSLNAVINAKCELQVNTSEFNSTSIKRYVLIQIII